MSGSRQREASSAGAVRAAIPVPSPVVRRWNDILSASPVDLNQLGGVIGENAPLANQILKLANSSLFNLPLPASSIEQAVVAIGADNLRTLVLAWELVEWVATRLRAEDSDAFWRHGFLTAFFSQHLAQWLLPAAAEQAYLAGFLHDIGRAPLLIAAAPSAATLSPLAGVEESLDAEEAALGVNHCEIGADLGARWGFPPPLVAVFAGHHDRSLAAQAPLVRIVAVADALAQSRQPELAGERSGVAGRTASERLLERYFPGLDAPARAALADALESAYADVSEERTRGLAGFLTPAHPLRLSR